MSRPHWRVRPARDEDVPALLDLFETCFGWRMSPALWAWKYRARKAPAPSVWVATDAEDRPIFQYGGMPIELQIPGGGTRPAMSGADVMTDPGWRRRGVFAAVMAEAHDAWREAGMAAVIGLPTAQWGSRTRVLDWRPLFPMRFFLRPIDSHALLARRLPAALVPRSVGRWTERVLTALAPRAGSDAGGALRVEEGRAHDPDLDSTLEVAWAQARDPVACTVRRGADWVRWRYLEAPRHDYRLLLAYRHDGPVGWLVVRIDPPPIARAFVVETVVRRDDGATRATLRHAAVGLAREHGATAIAVLGTGGRDDAGLARSGFLCPWGRYTFRFVPLDPALPLPSMGRRDGWHLAGGDFDVL